jgi:hypothetical protein
MADFENVLQTNSTQTRQQHGDWKKIPVVSFRQKGKNGNIQDGKKNHHTLHRSKLESPLENIERIHPEESNQHGRCRLPVNV